MLLEKRRERTASIPTASMADIAFLLLTFFLVTTSLDLDKGLQLKIPPKGESKPIPKSRIASLFINETGEVMLDDNIIPISGIKERIKVRLAEQNDLIVSIKTDRKTKYQVYVSVLDQVQLANATMISLAEPEK
jgi:biopolymer transport protein ExbD